MGVDFNKEKTWVGSNIALHARLKRLKGYKCCNVGLRTRPDLTL